MPVAESALITKQYDGMFGHTLTHATGTIASSGDNAVLSAPGAGKRIVVVAWSVQAEAAATTIILKDGSTATKRAYCEAAGDMGGEAYPLGREWRLATNAALNINLSAANSTGYNITYYVEAL